MQWVHVIGEVRTTQDPNGNTIQQTIFPRPPTGARFEVVLQKPGSGSEPPEELWRVCVENSPVPMGEFLSHPGVEVLTPDEAQALGQEWVPTFQLPT